MATFRPRTVADGEPMRTIGGGLYFTCCDCGLTHFLLVEDCGDGELVLRGWRDEAATLWHRARRKRSGR